MAHPPFILFIFFFLSATAAGEDLRLSLEEQESAYLALESVAPDKNWRSLYSDDLCLSGPHGVVCDFFPNETSSSPSSASSSLHIIELNFGFVSDFSPNPNCSSNATLPSSLSSLPFLRKIFFYHCFVTKKTNLDSLFMKGLPPSLEEIVFINNPALVGRIGGTVANFYKLSRLIVTNTAISGSIPNEIGALKQLKQLVLSRNRFRGSIPSSVGNLETLKILDLSGNRISGGFPTAIGRLSELIKLDLSSNRISGPVFFEKNQLKNLEFLDLSVNNLTGGVPTAIGEMVSLRELYLSGNAFGGQIPEIWETLRGMLGIGMSRMGLVGNIPSSMGVFLQNICYLGLDGNFLEGEVPEEFRNLEVTAGEINLENNRLSGRIPFSAGYLSRMGSKLKVGGNDELCLGGELVGHVRGSVGQLEECAKLEKPIPVLLISNGVSFLQRGFLFWVFFFCFVLVAFFVEMGFLFCPF